MNYREIALLIMMAAYFVGLTWALLALRDRKVPWWAATLVYGVAVSSAYMIYGEGFDMGLLTELCQTMALHKSPWDMQHMFIYLPGYPLAAYFTGLCIRDSHHVWVMKSVHALALFAAGYLGGKAVHGKGKDSGWRGVLEFSCNPVIVIELLWRGQFEVFNLLFMTLSLALGYGLSVKPAQDFKQGFYWGMASTFKHWCVLFVPLSAPLDWKRALRYGAGMVTAVALVLAVFAMVNGRFHSFFHILTYQGLALHESLLSSVFNVSEPKGWNWVALGSALALGLILRFKGKAPEVALALGILCFLLLGFRTVSQYWVWFLVPAYFCAQRKAYYWALSILLGVHLFLWGWSTQFLEDARYKDIIAAARWCDGVVFPLALVAVLAVWQAWLVAEFKTEKAGAQTPARSL